MDQGIKIRQNFVVHGRLLINLHRGDLSNDSGMWAALGRSIKMSYYLKFVGAWILIRVGFMLGSGEVFPQDSIFEGKFLLQSLLHDHRIMIEIASAMKGRLTMLRVKKTKSTRVRHMRRHCTAQINIRRYYHICIYAVLRTRPVSHELKM